MSPSRSLSSYYTPRSPSSRRPSHVSIPRLRDAIHRIDSKMASLMSEKHELESYLEQAVRLQSPVLRIPSELLGSIFVISVFGMGDDNPVMVSTLMLVCRYWADVVLDTPILFSKISVSPHDSIDKARRKLARSKSCPLDISINFGPRMEYTSRITEHVMHAMDLIRPALWRTRSFSLSVPNRPQAHAALARCQEEAPLLETLSIQIYHSMQEDHYSSPHLPLFKGHTPRLTSCSLTSFIFGWDLRLVSRLRVLKLGGYFNGYAPSSSTLLGILAQCPDLEELTLRNMSDVDSDPCYRAVVEDLELLPISKVIRLPRLTKVTFYYSGNVFTRTIMRQISLPNLESLEMCYLENVSQVLQLLYEQALTRLPLKYLRIESCLFNELKFVNLLRRLPSLATLDLVDTEDASSSFLKALSSPQSWVCPRLETVVFDGCTSFDWDSLRTFVESRLPANSYPQYQSIEAFRSRNIAVASSSASACARRRPIVRSASHAVLPGPKRIRSMDVTRCNQISKEMVQWLRMYVPQVKCEAAKGLWGETFA
ncbi:hypothetical protein E1B28_012358 [Marasmius oreades]|uniref:F-box domain-containing protein n=1 Tax=Marasmius oreades TaxID=181124 RepID=A0A9P7UQP8_9AGAR|nr:uncharacterized protein E1B28_012358 [Marasmius oreades]KAG7088354.1 hypothetical protein E1B28_012358 [Marasmius oreades]